MPEQLAFDHGLMDLFPKSVGTAGPPPSAPPEAVTSDGLTMGYYDGNTVTALWKLCSRSFIARNYAAPPATRARDGCVASNSAASAK
jgi:phospholipase C